MKRSESIAEIAAALGTFTAAVGPVVKTQVGKIKGTTAGGKSYDYEYRYADLSSQREHVREELSKNGLAVTQSVGSDGGQVSVETLLMHTSGQWLEADMLLIKTDGKAQSMGSAMTYGRRYQYQGILGLAAEEDDDGKAASANAPAPTDKAATKKGLASEKQVSLILALAKDLGWADEYLTDTLKRKGHDHPGDLTGGREGEASKMIDYMTGKVNALKAEKDAERKAANDATTAEAELGGEEVNDLTGPEIEFHHLAFGRGERLHHVNRTHVI